MLEHLIKRIKEFHILSILVIEKRRENYRHLKVTTSESFTNYGIVDLVSDDITAETLLSSGFLVRKYGKSSWEVFFNS